jgi:non-lysosomal glucosylceramidase
MPCCPNTNRRKFMQLVGSGIAGLYQFGWSHAAWPGTRNDPGSAEAVAADHFVPAIKDLDATWLRSLFQRGRRRSYRGKELETIGMPCGGICAGQLYVRGDGTLAHWCLDNHTYNTGYGARPETSTPVGTYGQNYNSFRPYSPIEQGFAVTVAAGNGKPVTRRLDRSGFDDIRFFGEYPVATIDYRSKNAAPLPLKVQAEVFSPFIPLNARDSGLPATVLRFRLTNTSDVEVVARLTGWLENPVFMHQRGRMAAEVRNRVVREDGLTAVVMDAVESSQVPDMEGEVEVFEDFENGNFDNWTVEGTAFGNRPATGVLPDQKPRPSPFEIDMDLSLKNWQGSFFANSFHGGVSAKGRLISKPFTIKKPYILFHVGGGMNPDSTGIRLVIGDRAVRSDIGSVFDLALHQRYWEVSEFIGQTARLEIYDDSAIPYLGQINIDQIAFADRPPLDAEVFGAEHSQYGNVALCTLGRGAVADAGSVDELLPRIAKGRILEDSGEARRMLGDALIGAVNTNLILAPGETAESVFLVCWYFPNRAVGNGGFALSGQPVIDGERVGNAYANWFESAHDVARYVAGDFERLSGATFAFRDSYFDSTLPYWFLQRVGMPLSILATETCQRWGNGRFWGWEGVGCCLGTCNHVWNYSQGQARLFPELEQTVRERQDLDETMDAATGEVMARGSVPSAFPNVNAMDGQAGVVLKSYREHLVTADHEFLKRNWPRIKLALAWLLSEDGNRDGILEAKQHTTYDTDLYGANTMVGSLYLAALRAGEEMARLQGESDYADALRQVFERGRQNTLDRLWNGEYFVQDVNLENHPMFQYGDGCLADQLFGQSWAHQLGLGYVYPQEHVRSALDAIWRYNWAPDVAPQATHHAPMRVFASPGESGLFTCTWPRSKHMGDAAVLYKNEVWTGIEYQVASHMLHEGMVEQGLAIVRAIHDRYDGVKHNPWNEIECGDHYARALASWGCLLGIAGYSYDGPAARIGFAPKMTPEEFKVFFSGAEGWGGYIQTRDETSQRSTVDLKWGRLRVARVELEIPIAWSQPHVAVTAAGRDIAAALEVNDTQAMVALDEVIELNAGEKLEIELSSQAATS